LADRTIGHPLKKEGVSSKYSAGHRERKRGKEGGRGTTSRKKNIMGKGAFKDRCKNIESVGYN